MNFKLASSPLLLRVIADKAIEHDAALITFTCNENSYIAKKSHGVIKLPAQSSLDGSTESIQPMKTYVEQSTLVNTDKSKNKNFHIIFY